MKRILLSLFLSTSILSAQDTTTITGSLTVGGSIDAPPPILTVFCDPGTQGAGALGFRLNAGSDIAWLTLGGKWTANQYIGRVGTSATEGVAPIQPWTQTETVGNVGTGEDTLFTATLAGGSLPVTGSTVEAMGLLHVAANSNAKTIRIKFGGNVFGTLVPGDDENHILFHAFIVRLSNGTQKAWVQFSGVDCNYNAYTALSCNLANSNILLVTGEGVSTNDIELLHLWGRHW